MNFNKVKQGLMKIDKHFFNGNCKKIYFRNFKYKGKACTLTSELYFPPHTASNKRIRLGPAGELLAVGGDLSTERMMLAYKNGICPLFFDDQPILWWTSEIRCVLFPEDIHISKEMLRVIKSSKYHLTVDRVFHEVVYACAESRSDYTWLTPERMKASFDLHELGFAHSVEVWEDDKLAGGLFFVSFGSCYIGDSMFARVKHASKFAFLALSLRLREMNYTIQDCGIWPTDHLQSMGAVIISRDEFLGILDESAEKPDIVKDWRDLFENWDFILAAKDYLNKNSKK